ncbi:Multidrug efflux pump subunit AcrB [Colwellia chukchiensis]|uniref:Multidrug efflux pump subunit AcrB n=1 Tax=Colwellia chukchiensis TaxID=641665 RepID=A0A1H7RYH4_9GAMM|nr:efflux RND transporter permease subunit [Colwellia chukchiensis]SEL64704.1 Multidrug efflux pump subunit AcrB [Colwellia chukchiensis]
MSRQQGITEKVVAWVLNSKLPLFLLVLSILSGVIALKYTPREEEPQIVVPMIDIIVTAPGVNAQQAARLVTTPLEKLLAQIRGVEHVYSVSNNGQVVVTLRFHVGENRENALLNTYNKLHSNIDQIPAIVSDWRVSPVEVDDVPILMLGLWSKVANQVDDFALRQLAEEVSTYLQTIEDTSEVKVIGGRSREIRIQLDPEQMAARQVAISDVIKAIQASNQLQHLGQITLANSSVILESGDVFRDKANLALAPISAVNGSTVILKDIATVLDGAAEQTSYQWLDHKHRQTAKKHNYQPMVTISVAKQQGSNAVNVAKAVHDKIAALQQSIFPDGVYVEVLRDYGETANEKVNSLTTSLAFAVFTVVVFIGVFLGWRPALVVGLAVPICYGITLSLDLAFGYTINRVTLFALILSLGLLVDDPITGVDNIERYLQKGKGSLKEKIVSAISEIRVPLAMSTLTIVLAFIPLAFITGMMGPYMAPMAFNVPLSVISSTLVAFLVTPWLAAKIIKPKLHTQTGSPNQGFSQLYRRVLTPLLTHRAKGKAALWVLFALFIAAAMLPVLRLVPLKLLPFDNKNEVQIIVDMPESATLEQTAAMTQKVSTILQQLPEVKAIANYVGAPSAIDFNGMVRQYYLRHKPNLADMRVILIDKSARQHQSHGVVLRMRELLAPLNRDGIKLKVIEVPPGPPVMSTLVAELYGDEFTQYQQLRDAATRVANRLTIEPHVVEVDTSVGAQQSRLRFITDKNKAALSGIATQDINQALEVANRGKIISFMHHDSNATPLPITLQLPIAQRSSISDLQRIAIKGQLGAVQQTTPQGIELAPQALVALGELGHFAQQTNDKAIYHKDLRPVVYVSADISGRTPAEVIADVSADFNGKIESSNWQERTFLSNGGGQSWTLPEHIKMRWSGEGEWRITIRVFRDMGLAFAFALLAIYIVLRIQTQSAALSGIIMSAIPLTVIGIMPGFLLLNQLGEREIAGAPEPILFTATAMIGMIALAGIVVRNSLILIEFITQARAAGAPIKEALIQAGSIRMRPVLLTAGTTLLGNLIITLDPVFSGLAIAIIFGIISSTLFTLLVVPIVYALIFDKPNNTAKTEETL